jgi:hypothetical protein
MLKSFAHLTLQKSLDEEYSCPLVDAPEFANQYFEYARVCPPKVYPLVETGFQDHLLR